jgi:hypothetical protein
MHPLQWLDLRQLWPMLVIYFPCFGASGCTQLTAASGAPPLLSYNRNQGNICAAKGQS